MSTNSNHFSKIVQDVQRAPTNQRTAALIDGIAQQMQQSNNPETNQLGAELVGVKPQLVQACQQA